MVLGLGNVVFIYTRISYGTRSRTKCIATQIQRRASYGGISVMK